jgi:hypothetical protein
VVPKQTLLQQVISGVQGCPFRMHIPLSMFPPDPEPDPEPEPELDPESGAASAESAPPESVTPESTPDSLPLSPPELEPESPMPLSPPELEPELDPEESPALLSSPPLELLELSGGDSHCPAAQLSPVMHWCLH